MSGNPIIGIENRQALAKELLPTITLAEVNALARSSFTDENRVVLVAAPKSPDVKMPTKEQMLAVFDRAKRSATHGLRGLDLERAADSDSADARQDRERAHARQHGHPRVEALEWRARAAQADGLQGR